MTPRLSSIRLCLRRLGCSVMFAVSVRHRSVQCVRVVRYVRSVRSARRIGIPGFVWVRWRYILLNYLIIYSIIYFSNYLLVNLFSLTFVPVSFRGLLQVWRYWLIISVGDCLKNINIYSWDFWKFWTWLLELNIGVGASHLTNWTFLGRIYYYDQTS